MPPDPTPAAVRAELERVVASDGFVNSERLTRFLRFAVEKTLAGEGDQLKEYLLGVEVFDRGATFDPRMDPIVRVEARRLRAKLEEYYAGAGRAAEVQIVCRKGSYVPVFEQGNAKPTGVLTVPMYKRVAYVMLALGFAWWAWSRTGGRAEPVSIVVVPMDTLAGDQSPDKLADGIAEALSIELARDSTWNVVAWPNVLRYRRDYQEVRQRPVKQVARELRAEAVVAVSVEIRDGRARVNTILLEPKSGYNYKSWGRSYERSTTDALAMEQELARVIAEELRSQWNSRGAGKKL